MFSHLIYSLCRILGTLAFALALCFATFAQAQTCNCADTGKCTCGPACECGLQVSPQTQLVQFFAQRSACANGSCSNGSCSMIATGTHYEWTPYKDDATKFWLCSWKAGDKVQAHVGGWDSVTKTYLPFDSKAWGKACAPPITPPGATAPAISVIGSECANGSCSGGVTGRRGLFGRR
jgi:hypothetical protein